MMLFGVCQWKIESKIKMWCDRSGACLGESCLTNINKTVLFSQPPLSCLGVHASNAAWHIYNPAYCSVGVFKLPFGLKWRMKKNFVKGLYKWKEVSDFASNANSAPCTDLCRFVTNLSLPINLWKRSLLHAFCFMHRERKIKRMRTRAQIDRLKLSTIKDWAIWWINKQSRLSQNV